MWVKNNIFPQSVLLCTLLQGPLEKPSSEVDSKSKAEHFPSLASSIHEHIKAHLLERITRPLRLGGEPRWATTADSRGREAATFHQCLGNYQCSLRFHYSGRRLLHAGRRQREQQSEWTELYELIRLTLVANGSLHLIKEGERAAHVRSNFTSEQKMWSFLRDWPQFRSTQVRWC